MNFEKQDEEITLVVNKAPGNKNLPHGLCSRMSTRAYCSGGRGGSASSIGSCRLRFFPRAYNIRRLIRKKYL